MAKLKLYIILIIIGLSSSSYGQSLKSFLTAAEQAFEKRDYGAALNYYLTANEFDENRTDLLYKSAESARMYNALNVAEEKYQSVYDQESQSEFPLASFWLADIKQRLGKYDDAKRLYEVYLSEHQDEDAYLTAKAKKEIAACDWAKELINNPSENIVIEQLAGDINSSNTDFNPIVYDTFLYYSSMRFNKAKDLYIPARIISKVLKTSDGLSSSVIPASGNFNSDLLNTANISFNYKGDKVYFTICDYTEKINIRCDIYYSVVNADGTFGEPVKLPDYINEPSATNTHPNIGYSRKTRQEILYFASDRAGGKGKLDIYYVYMDKAGNFTRPLNLDIINTPEDEITPFYHSESDILYFSSEGYKSMGGFDVYAISFDDSNAREVIHMGYPLNSSYNDIYYFLDKEGGKAYFSSNREGAQFLDPAYEACCYDIYKANISELEIDLIAQSFNKQTAAPLMGAKFKLFDANTHQLLGEVQNDDSYESKFKLASNKSYYVVAELEEFIPDTVHFNTFNIRKSTTLTKKLYLDQTPLVLEVFILDKITKFPINGTEITLKNLTNPEIPDIVMLNPDGNDFRMNVLRGVQYKLIAKNPNYAPQEILISTHNVVGPKIVQYVYMGDLLNVQLPLSVYFDNDRPEPRSMALTTNKTYTQTYTEYYAKKPEFIQAIIDGLTEEDISVPMQRMDNYFEFFVKGGKERFDEFLKTLLIVLRQGYQLEIEIQGYASPRAESAYNLALGQRRISSVRNELYQYQNGALRPFLKKGALKVREVSYGDSLSPADVSDNLLDLKNSVYSISASNERRVEIIRVEID